MKTLYEANIEKGMRVLIRCEFNCPLSEEGKILDDRRIQAVIPTIQYLSEKNAKIILMGHLGRPRGEVVENLRLTPIVDRLFNYLSLQISKAPDCVGEDIEKMIKEMWIGEILLLENLRFHKGEEKNDDAFAKKLSLLGDIFVNDAFGVCHRKHASVVGVPKYLPSFAGFSLEEENKVMTQILENSERPLVAIFGGAKIDTKLPVIEKFLDIADYILIGGKIANEINFFHPKILLPIDFIGDRSDIGPKTQNKFKKVISRAKTIVLNGPMGRLEKKEFENGTKEIIKAVSENKGFKIAGGGETLLAIFKYNLQGSFDFISTGGASMLKFLAGENLPGIEALENNRL